MYCSLLYYLEAGGEAQKPEALLVHVEGQGAVKLADPCWREILMGPWSAGVK